MKRTPGDRSVGAGSGDRLVWPSRFAVERDQEGCRRRVKRGGRLTSSRPRKTSRPTLRARRMVELLETTDTPLTPQNDRIEDAD